MSRKCPQHTKQFKLDAVNYRKEHPDLTQTEVAKNLGICHNTDNTHRSIGSLVHWTWYNLTLFPLGVFKGGAFEPPWEMALAGIKEGRRSRYKTTRLLIIVI